MRVVFQLASFSQISEAPFVAISPFRGDPLEEQIAEVAQIVGPGLAISDAVDPMMVTEPHIHT